MDGRANPVPLSLLGEFQKDVAEFLRGASRGIDPSEVLVSMEDGSLALVATGLGAATTLWADLARPETQDALSRSKTGCRDRTLAGVFAAESHVFLGHRISDPSRSMCLMAR
ncbi:hypothetical protein [Castellaniella denitrificans]|uniref:Roadblock/LAMTOR2 domain-containing protein n=1 Tax=Castellaniella denitrificans TaxID=56119 RepID=A0ABT4LZP4_9BURK|nr:hypothetical protein [Castellaniella denitrificans]MCZ4328527.1 hypothetical protein [Castellaniella denitrificans]